MQLQLERVPLPAAGLVQTFSCKLQNLNVSTPHGSRGVGFPWTGFWSALREIRVELSTLIVQGSETAMDVMYIYLISYTGLQKLEIHGIKMDRQDLEDIAGRTF